LSPLCSACPPRQNAGSGNQVPNPGIQESRLLRRQHLVDVHQSPAGGAALRGVLCFCNSPQMNQVEAYIQFKPGLIGADGEVTDKGTQEFLRNYMKELRAFIVRVLTVLPRDA
jgi:hypothetical protein